MKKKLLAFVVSMALVLSLAGCGSADPGQPEAPADEPQGTADVQTPAQSDEQPAPSETPEPDAGRQDGERFEAVIMLEGMEEAVQYEHAVNETAGFEIDYDYESFVRRSEADRERFISLWDDPEKPETFLEVTRSAENADAVAAAVSETLSKDYDITREPCPLDRADNCVRIEASAIKGTNRMAEHLQAVYIIPAAEGCLVATAHYTIEGAEGFGHRLHYMVNTLEAIDR